MTVAGIKVKLKAGAFLHGRTATAHANHGRPRRGVFSLSIALEPPRDTRIRLLATDAKSMGSVARRRDAHPGLLPDPSPEGRDWHL